jgi:hypothetical protein
LAARLILNNVGLEPENHQLGVVGLWPDTVVAAWRFTAWVNLCFEDTFADATTNI